MDTGLNASLGDDLVRLEPLQEGHRECLRAACGADNDIWQIYPVSMQGEHFDPVFGALLGRQGWVPFAVANGEGIVGMTSYINADRANGVVEIGGTFIAPHVRGGPFNLAMKTLMIEHAFAAGYSRIEFRVDARNLRSQRAVEKLGATREGLLRKNSVTWTGHVRDTVVFGLLRDEWR